MCASPEREISEWKILKILYWILKHFCRLLFTRESSTSEWMCGCRRHILPYENVERNEILLRIMKRREWRKIRECFGVLRKWRLSYFWIIRPHHPSGIQFLFNKILFQLQTPINAGRHSRTAPIYKRRVPPYIKCILSMLKISKHKLVS